MPRAAERIFAMAEEDAKHRQQLENNALNFAANETRRGQYFGLTIALAGLITSIMALYFGSEAVAGVIGGTTVVGLVTVFVTGRVIREKNDGGTK